MPFSSRKLTDRASACAVESVNRQKSGFKSCGKRNESAGSLSDSSSQSLVIKPRHSQALETCNSNAAVVFSDILSCATRTSHSDDSCLVQNRACPVSDRAGDSSPFPRFPRDSNCNHRPEAPSLHEQRLHANSPMQQIYETAGHNSENQWQQQQQQQRQYWQPLQQSHQRQQTLKQQQQQATQFRPMKQHPQPCQGQQRRQQPPAVPPTQRPGPQKRQQRRVAGSPGGIYSPAKARNTRVHQADPTADQFGGVSSDDAAVPGGRPVKVQKRPKVRQHPAKLQQKPKQYLAVSAQRQQQPAAAPTTPRCARCPSKPRPCPVKQRRLLKKRPKKRQRKQQTVDCQPGEASCGDCQPPRIVLCPAKRGRENFSRVKLQTQPGRFITRQVLFFDGSYLYKPERPNCPCF